MTSKKRRALFLIITLTFMLLGLALESYGGSASIEYEYDEVGNIKKKKVTYSGFPPPIN